MSDLVGNPEDLFSHNKAHLMTRSRLDGGGRDGHMVQGPSLVISRQGQVVQCIVSLTTSLSRQLIKYMLTTLSNPLLFLLKKCENLLQCKRFSQLQKILTFFQQKINGGFEIFTFFFKF